jgi:large subunit ribosomal protein L10
MPRAEKIEQVELLTEKLRATKAAVLADYRGLTVAQMGDLRGQLRAAQVEFRVVKNTLARRAVVESGRDGSLANLFLGPVAVAFGYGQDIGAPIRLLREFARSERLEMEVKGGLVEGRVLGPGELDQVADLPAREVLVSQLLGALQGPAGQLVGAIQAPVQELVGLLEAYREKIEGQATAAAGA